MLRSSLIVSSLSIATMTVNFVTQLVAASFFGTSAQMDSYLLGISIPMFWIGLAGSAMSYALIPVLTWSSTQNPAGHAKFEAAAFQVVLLGALAVSGLGLLLTPTLLNLMAPQLTASLRETATLTCRLGWIAFLLSTIMAFLACQINSRSAFTAPMLANLMPALGSLLAMFFLRESKGVTCLAWGLCTGYAFGFLFLLHQSGHRVGLLSPPQAEEWNRLVPVIRTIPLVCLATGCYAIITASDALWGNRLGESMVAILGYGQRLTVAIGNTIILGPLTVLTPYLARQSASGNLDEVRRMMRRVLRLLWLVGLPPVLTFLVVRRELVTVLLVRGAFTQADAAILASVLAWLFAGMLPMLCSALLFRALFAMGEVKTAARLGFTIAIGYLGASGLLSGWLGIRGIALAYFFVWSAGALLLRRFVLGPMSSRQLLRDGLVMCAKLSVAAAACGLVATLGRACFLGAPSGAGKLGLALGVGITVLLSTVAFLSVAHLILGIRDVLEIVLPRVERLWTRLAGQSNRT